MTSVTRSITVPWLRLSGVGLLALTACLTCGRAEAQTHNQAQAPPQWAYTLRSPYRSLPRAEQLVAPEQLTLPLG